MACATEQYWSLIHIAVDRSAEAGMHLVCRFQRRTEVYTSLWCCVDAHPGHVWYDMWWDQIPHEDRHKRQISDSWKPTTGP